MEYFLYTTGILPNHITNGETKRNQITAYLLERESKGVGLPRDQCVRIRGKFDIPFKTDAYKRWVSQ